MYNMDEEQTQLKLLATDTYDSLNKINSRMKQQWKNSSQHFCLYIHKLADSLDISKTEKLFA